MFFTYFKQIMSSGVDYNLTISQTATGDLVVIVLPKVHNLKDGAQHQIGPLQLKGSAEELDRGFFPSITAPIRKTSGLLVNMAEYERQQDTAAAESKAVKEQKEKLSKEGKEKKEKYDGFMKKAEEMEGTGDLDGALLQLQQARIHATDKAAKTIDQKITEIKAKMGEGTLFGVAPTITPDAQQSTVVPEQPMPQPAVVQPAFAPVVAQPIVPQPEGTPVNTPIPPASAQSQEMVPRPSDTMARPEAGYAASVANNNENGIPLYGMTGHTNTEHSEYGSLIRPTEDSYPTHREGEYDGYLDFMPHAGGGMGAPAMF